MMRRSEFVIVWASSIPGRFPATDSLAQKTSRGRADHRLYYVTTKDFKTYSHAALLYDGGFCAIDGTITKRGDTYYLVMKDETFYPPRRNLRIASSKHATGPYGPASPSFTEGHRGAVGAADGRLVVRLLRRVHARTLRRRADARLRALGAVPDSLKTPRGIRHGSAFLAPQSVLRGLLALDSTGR